VNVPTAPSLAVAGALLLATCLAAQAEPSPEETEVLCWLNHFRRDPRAFARLVAAGNRPTPSDGVDWQRFADELAELQPAPPLFFAARLIDASRAHASYVVATREYGHHETPGRPGFTGEWPQDRARAAGYLARVAECSVANGGAGLHLVAGYVVDAAPPGTGSHGMQDGRGHRRCLIDPKWREVGVGMFAWGNGNWSNVILCGEPPTAGRQLGGVAIDDRDGDAFYDVGEGIGGMHIAVGDRSTLTSASGAWHLDLTPGTTAQRLVARRGELEVVRDLAPGSDGLWLDLHVDVRRAIADLEAKLGSLPATATAEQRALRLRLLELRAPASPPEADLAAEVDALRRVVLAGLGTWTQAEADRTLQAARKAFAGTVVAAWLDSARTADRLARAAAVAGGSTATRTKRLAAVLADLDRALPTIPSPDLWRWLVDLRHRLLPR
jgi:hypothetical protein